ncbi:MAG: LysR family transcriptional regulator [Leptolyngbyaceae cyanobacterium SM1_4_3]|nr:LysR family transcriptional regulator [Leptolyngbyaceae cyanobacterium SM1_4_3]NJN92311.1 LysR family transcriptional regulator [Leptolyngbyaceae cyanobacterium SL_5_14]
MRSNPKSLFTLAQLRVLIAVAKHQNFSEAASQLQMSQSSVSSAIATLETELGVILFARGRHGASLTPVGEQVLAHAEQMVQLQKEIYKTVNLAKTLQGGKVRVTSFRSITTHFLSGVIAQFRQQFPQISVSILEQADNQHIVNALRKGQADIGIVDRPLDDQFDTWELLRDEYVVLLPSSFQVKGSALSWDNLSSYPFVMFSEGNQHDEEIFAHCDEEVLAHCAAFNTSLQVAYWAQADSSIVSMVAQGLGATIIPRLAAEPIPNNIQVFSLPQPLFRSIRAAVLADALFPPSVFAFWEMLKAASKFYS